VRSLYRLTAGQDYARRVGPAVPPWGNDLLAVAKDNRPPAVKYLLLVTGIREDRRVLGADYKGMAGWLQEVARAPDVPDGEVDRLVDLLCDAVESIGTDELIVARPDVFDAYDKLAPKASGPHVARARVMIARAYNARGTAHSDNLTDEARQKVADRLTDAEKLFTEAAGLEPTDPRPGSWMVWVKNVQGGDRAEMEKWFARAMAADPDDLVACRNKLQYLSPAAHGSHEDMIAFGRECLKTENWRGGLPYLLIDAHEAVAQDSGDAKEYWARADVWADVEAVFEGAVLNFPDDVFRRSQYAKWAAQCGHWDVADRQFERLADRAVVGVFGSKSSYDYLRRKAARLGRGPTTGPAAATTAPTSQ
jgi:hypothetical protein